MRRKLAVIAGIVLLAGFVAFCAGMAWIYVTTAKVTRNAQAAYGGNAVEALVKTLESETHTFRERNDAIWALGQLADARALPTLQKYYTGVPESREPLDGTLSQYELRKAIRWCEEGNITSWMYVFIKKEREGGS